MKEEALKIFRSASREHLHFLWEKAKKTIWTVWIPQTMFDIALV
jgi:hypothetical protein